MGGTVNRPDDAKLWRPAAWSNRDRWWWLTTFMPKRLRRVLPCPYCNGVPGCDCDAVGLHVGGGHYAWCGVFECHWCGR